MKKKNITRLKVNEVSLVDHAANGELFLFIKRLNMDKLDPKTLDNMVSKEQADEFLKTIQDTIDSKVEAGIEAAMAKHSKEKTEGKEFAISVTADGDVLVKGQKIATGNGHEDLLKMAFEAIEKKLGTSTTEKLDDYRRKSESEISALTDMVKSMGATLEKLSVTPATMSASDDVEVEEDTKTPENVEKKATNIFSTLFPRKYR